MDDKWALPDREGRDSLFSDSAFPKRTWEQPQSDSPQHWPVSVCILGTLHIVAGVLCVSVLMPSAAHRGPGADFFIAAFAFAGVVLMATGVGLIRGSAWAWWVSTFLYMFTLMRNGVGFFIVGVWPESEWGQSIHGGVVAARIVFQGAVCLFLFRRRVLTHFRLERVNRGPIALGLAIGGLALAVAWCLVLGRVAFS